MLHVMNPAEAACHAWLEIQLIVLKYRIIPKNDFENSRQIQDGISKH